MKAQSSKQDSLLAAVKANNLEETKKILNNHGLVLDQNFSDYKLLIQALILGHKKIAKLLLDNGCRVFCNQKTNTYNTPLYYAVNLKCLELVKILLDKGASIEGKDANKETPLAFAMKNKYFQIVDLMFSNYKINLTNINNEDQVTHFHIAVMRNNTKLVKTFLEHGMKVDQVSKIKSSTSQGYTPLHFAVEHHSIETVKLLLSKKANFGLKNAQGWTPLHLAFYLKNSKENDEIINLILSAHLKVMINPFDNNGVSHFHIACCKCNSELLLKAFVKSGADCNTCIFSHSSFLPGYAPLHIAVTYKCKNTVQFLLDNKADVNKAIDLGVTPLHLAVKSEDIEIVKILLQYNADVCATDSESNTPIHKAFDVMHTFKVTKTRTAILALLFLTHEGNLKNVSNKYGISLLHIACTVVGYPQIVENFLKQNVDINACVKRNVSENSYPGFSVLHFAVMAGNLEVIQILMEHNVALKMINSDNHSTLYWVCKHWFDGAVSLIEDIAAASPTKTLKDEDFRVCMLNTLRLFDDNRHQILKLFLNRKEMYDSIMFDVCDMLYHLISKEALYAQDKMFLLRVNQIVAIFKIIMMTLIDHGYDTNKKNNKNLSILIYVISLLRICYSVSIIEFIELLLIRGAEVDFEVDNGVTPLMVAAKEGLDEVVEILLKYKANPNKYSITRNTPLHMALASTLVNTANKISNTPKVVDLLVAKGAKVDVENCENYTPLHYAAELVGLHKGLVCLLKHNCKVDSKNNLGNTALHVACSNLNLPGLITLLNYGANINLVNERNLTPLELMMLYKPSEYMILYKADNIEMLKLLELHIIKLNCIGFKVSEKNNCACKKIKSYCKELDMMLWNAEPTEEDFATCDEDNIFIDFCERELERMKNVKIDKFDTSLYSIIFKNAHEVSKNVNSESFKELVNSRELKENFPLYGYIINLQYKKGLKRYTLLKPAEIVLQKLLTNLPDLCCERILASFTNQELKKLIM